MKLCAELKGCPRSTYAPRQDGQDLVRIPVPVKLKGNLIKSKARFLPWKVLAR